MFKSTKSKIKWAVEMVLLSAGRPEVADALLPSRRTELNELYRSIPSQIARLSPEGQLKAIDAFVNLKSQIGQDLWVMSALGLAYCLHPELSANPLSNRGKERGGFFVEVGAFDGVSLSNSYVFEKVLGWQGLCIEPSRASAANLRKNRSCSVIEAAAWSESGKSMEFLEASAGELSTLSGFEKADWARDLRHDSHRYVVTTVTLRDALSQIDAPDTIDYLSVDTEGSELEVLRGFPWDSRRVKVATVEHNSTENRKHLVRFMKAKGFRVINYSVSVFDCWFVNDDAMRKVK